MAKLKCAGCREYIDKEDAVRIGIQSFCNAACRLSAGKKVSRVKKRRTPGTDFRIRRRVRERDKSCRFCGTARNLHVHHVTYRSQGGSDEDSNLITLCFEHHALVHTDKDRFAPLCRGVIWLTYTGRRLSIPEFERVLSRSNYNSILKICS